MRYLVAGGAGFIGSAVVRMLIERTPREALDEGGAARQLPSRDR